MVRGGSNEDHSLREAKDNFENHYTIYRASDQNTYNREMNEMSLKEKMQQASSRAIQTSEETEWAEALLIGNEYNNRNS